uniref:Uncharacterized protein n=1 Tax=viral metagenome TaxID=1070528 RepID=A0A6C0E713_9ZZZZ
MTNLSTLETPTEQTSGKSKTTSFRLYQGNSQEFQVMRGLVCNNLLNKIINFF